VPLPIDTKPITIFPEFIAQTTNLCESLEFLQNSNEYLLLGNDSETLYASVHAMTQYPSSQFFRRRLVNYFGLPRPWDWRKYQSLENDVLETIKFFSN
jgi:hypothetical protein